MVSFVKGKKVWKTTWPCMEAGWKTSHSSTSCYDQKKQQRKTKSLTSVWKGYRVISKALGLKRTTSHYPHFRKNGRVLKPPRSNWLTRNTARVHRWLIQEVTEEPRSSSKDLQALLSFDKVRGHDSAIRDSMGGEIQQQKGSSHI